MEETEQIDNQHATKLFIPNEMEQILPEMARKVR